MALALGYGAIGVVRTVEGTAHAWSRRSPYAAARGRAPHAASRGEEASGRPPGRRREQGHGAPARRRTAAAA